MKLIEIMSRHSAVVQIEKHVDFDGVVSSTDGAPPIIESRDIGMTYL